MLINDKTVIEVTPDIRTLVFLLEMQKERYAYSYQILKNNIIIITQ